MPTVWKGQAMSERIFDEDSDDWKVGDWVVLEDERDGEPVQITHINEWGRVYWMENGEECMTRATNLLRVRQAQGGDASSSTS